MRYYCQNKTFQLSLAEAVFQFLCKTMQAEAKKTFMIGCRTATSLNEQTLSMNDALLDHGAFPFGQMTYFMKLAFI